MLIEKGKPMVYIFPTGAKPKAMNLWKKQIILDPRKKSLLAKRFVLNAIGAKANLLSELAKNRKRTNKEKSFQLINYRNRIRGIERKVKTIHIKDFKEFRKVLRGWEGFSAKIYFEALSHIVPEEFGYKGLRTRRPPKDLFNATISFGYGYLKYLVERKLLLLGINPYYGILHEESDKVYPFLTFDMMEGFRHSYIDRAIISLISKRILAPSKHSLKIRNGIFLNKRGKENVYRELHNLGNKKFYKIIDTEIKTFLKVF